MRYLQQAPGLQRSRGLAEAQELGVGRGIGRHFHQVVRFRYHFAVVANEDCPHGNLALIPSHSGFFQGHSHEALVVAR